MIQWVLRWWRERQRSIDLRILWPICCEQAPDLDHAKAAFMFHAMHDPAWTSLGEDEVIRRVDALERP